MPHFFNSFILFMCLFSAVLGHHGCTGFSLVVEVRGSSLLAVCGPLVAGAAPLMECGLWGAQTSVVAACGLGSCDSQALEHRLSSSGTWPYVALRHVGSFWTRDQTCVSCSGRQILYH